MFLIGTDEAGYGPNLGPLVIAATVWHLPEAKPSRRPIDLFARLKSHVAPGPVKDPMDRRVAVADSKVLYQSGKGLALLERGVLSAVSATGHRPATCRDLWDGVYAGDQLPEEMPWPHVWDGEVPLEVDPLDLEDTASEFCDGLRSAKVHLVAVRAVAVFPQRFNDLTESHGNKAEALSRLTLSLVADVLAPLADEPIVIYCDKHGGRNFYHRLLQLQFPEIFIEVFGEGQQASTYRWGPQERRIEVQFRVNCEEMLPTALASMTAKYLRELSMRAFNEFWRARVPDLRPTAGYYVDSQRFKREIAAVQAELKIDDRVLWRAR